MGKRTWRQCFARAAFVGVLVFVGWFVVDAGIGAVSDGIEVLTDDGEREWGGVLGGALRRAGPVGLAAAGLAFVLSRLVTGGAGDVVPMDHPRGGSVTWSGSHAGARGPDDED